MIGNILPVSHEITFYVNYWPAFVVTIGVYWKHCSRMTQNIIEVNITDITAFKMYMIRLRMRNSYSIAIAILHVLNFILQPPP